MFGALGTPLKPLALFAIPLVGFGTGILNTLAGGGSFLTLPLLIFAGLPPTVANGTNRLAILFQNLVASHSFRRAGVLDTGTGWRLALPVVAGAVIGAWLAVDLDENLFQRILGLVLLGLLVPLVLFPGPWLTGGRASAQGRGRLGEEAGPKLRPWVFVVFACVGFYGGFVQAGIGFVLLGALLLGVGQDLLRANALKVFLIFLYTILALGIFVWHQKVDLLSGMLLAAGNTSGAWIGTRIAVRGGPRFLRLVLAGAAVLASGKLLGLWNWLANAVAG